MYSMGLDLGGIVKWANEYNTMLADAVAPFHTKIYVQSSVDDIDKGTVWIF